MKSVKARVAVVLLLASMGCAACGASPGVGEVEVCPKSVILMKEVFSSSEPLIGKIVVSNGGQDTLTLKFTIDLYDSRDERLIDSVTLTPSVPADGQDYVVDWRIDTPDREGEYRLEIRTPGRSCAVRVQVRIS